MTKFEPKITLKGLEYLHENSMMQKIMRAAKGIKDTIPFI
ncbi:MAG: YjcQ family protein [Christensenellaceae bacterium]